MKNIELLQNSITMKTNAAILKLTGRPVSPNQTSEIEKEETAYNDTSEITEERMKTISNEKALLGNAQSLLKLNNKNWLRYTS